MSRQEFERSPTQESVKIQTVIARIAESARARGCWRVAFTLLFSAPAGGYSITETLAVL